MVTKVHACLDDLSVWKSFNLTIYDGGYGLPGACEGSNCKAHLWFLVFPGAPMMKQQSN